MGIFILKDNTFFIRMFNSTDKIYNSLKNETYKKGNHLTSSVIKIIYNIINCNKIFSKNKFVSEKEMEELNL